MTAAFNLSQLANKVNTSGQLDASTGISGTVPVANGGTGLTASGVSGNVLKSNGSAWVSAPLTTGKILQVVQGTMTVAGSSISVYPNFASTGLSATITPTLASSKILVLITANMASDSSTCHMRLYRGETPIDLTTLVSNIPQDTAFIHGMSTFGAIPTGINYLDAPATTAATTYSLRYCVGPSGTVYINRSNSDRAAGTYDGRGASTIILLEVAE